MVRGPMLALVPGADRPLKITADTGAHMFEELDLKITEATTNPTYWGSTCCRDTACCTSHTFTQAQKPPHR